MSYQKTKWKFPRKSLAKGSRGCNAPSTETRAEKLARKAAQRERFHAAAQDHDRITRIMAGERWVAGRKVDTHQYLPHQSDREIARRQRRAATA